jgi:hypothetical protein
VSFIKIALIFNKFLTLPFFSCIIYWFSREIICNFLLSLSFLALFIGFLERDYLCLPLKLNFSVFIKLEMMSKEVMEIEIRVHSFSTSNIYFLLLKKKMSVIFVKMCFL